MAHDVPTADFPVHRPRRLRATSTLRDLVAETDVRVTDLVAPLFVREAIDEPIAISSLPGVYQDTVDSLRRQVGESFAALGARAVILFGVPEHKDAIGSGAFDPDGIVQVALRKLRADLGDEVVLMADLCVDEYTDHGHCGIVRDGVVDNDATIEVYAKAAVAAGRRRRPRRRPERDDGRPGRSDPRGARRDGPSRCRDPRLLGEVREWAVRTVPRRRRRNDLRRR